MLRTKTMLFTLLAVALAVPSLWAQKENSSERGLSINEIKNSLQNDPDKLERMGMVVLRSTTGAAAICTGIAGGTGPTNYLAGTNKCTSSVPVYGFGNSLNVTSGSCADKGGIEGTWSVGMTVGQAGVAGSPFPSWGGPFNVGGTEYAFPVIYSTAITPSPDVVLTLKRHESVFGLEVSNETQQSYSVTFHTTAGDVALPAIDVGGTAEPFAQAQRFIGICHTAAIKGVTLHCNDCGGVSGNTTVGQIRGDKFPGF